MHCIDQSFNFLRFCQTVNKKYEERSIQQHQFLVKILANYFSNFSRKKLQMLTFYLILQKGEKIITTNNYPTDSFILLGFNRNNSQQLPCINILSHTNSIQLASSEYALVISFKSYLNCQALNQSSIQAQIQFFSTSEYLCSMPRKRYYWLLRNCQIHSYSFQQTIYYEGQQIHQQDKLLFSNKINNKNLHGSGVYLVRAGQLSYVKNNQNKKPVEVFRFAIGHLFGTLQISINSQLPYGSQYHYNHTSQKQPKSRIFTVISKSSHSVVYQFPESIYHNCIKIYCEKLVEQRQNKLMKFIVQNAKKNALLSKKYQEQSTLIHTESYNFEHRKKRTSTAEFSLMQQKRKSMNFPNLSTTKRNLQNDSFMRKSRIELKNKGPLNDYPMVARRAQFTSSQFRQIGLLLDKKNKFEALRIIKHTQNKKIRGQNEFQLLKKEKKMN